MQTIYPLDEVYSNATGVTYPVCGAKSSETPEPTPDQEQNPGQEPTPEQNQTPEQETTPDTESGQ